MDMSIYFFLVRYPYVLGKQIASLPHRTANGFIKNVNKHRNFFDFLTKPLTFQIKINSDNEPFSVKVDFFIPTTHGKRTKCEQHSSFAEKCQL